VTETLYVQLLNLAAGAFLLAGVLVLWRRELAVIIRVFAFQGAALSGIVGVLAAHERSPELGAVAAGILVLRAGVLPFLLRRALAVAGPSQRETSPLVNVSASLLAAAVLTLIAYAVSQPLVKLAPGPATHVIPIALTVVLIGLFVLVTRRHALSQLVGFLLVDNGITAIGFLTTSGVPLVVELGVSLDVLFAVLVLQILTTRMRATFGDLDLDDLRELHD
jgi:hydrogenase-4 component E